MPETDDITLLQQYARGGSETAFATLVERYVNLVYSTALRRTDSPHAAEEITQAVFIILAKKAGTLGRNTVLSGWLYHTARLTAANFLRGEIRRQHREQEAHMQSLVNEPNETWMQIAPLLEDAMADLSARDRDALVLRFFENKNLRDVGATLGASEDAAKMRVNRALEKLRKILASRGVHSTAPVIAGAVSAHSVHAAPLGLAKTISAVAIAKGAAAGGSTLALVKGALNVMAWTKAKTAVVVGIGVLLAAGTTTIGVKKIVAARTTDDSWRVRYFNSRFLDKAQPQVRIVPAKYPDGGGYGASSKGWMGLCLRLEGIISAAYRQSTIRTIYPSGMPNRTYDFIAKLPPGSKQDPLVALQTELKKQFGLTAHTETRETNILVLTDQNLPRPGLKPAAVRNQSGVSSGPGEIHIQNQSIQTLAGNLESIFQEPVIDRTGITGDHFDIDVHWDEKDWNHHNLEDLKRALTDQLGLELVPAREPIELLVVEKSN